MIDDPDWRANAAPDPRLAFAQTDPDTGIRFIVKPSPSDAFPGVWLGYVELPAELTEAEIDGLNTLDITGGFDRFIDWIVMEKGEAWTRAECLRVIAQMARLRDAHIARIAAAKAAKAADDAMPWPRWKVESYNPGSGNGWIAVFLKNKEHFCLASLRRVVQGRRIRSGGTTTLRHVVSGKCPHSKRAHKPWLIVALCRFPLRCCWPWNSGSRDHLSPQRRLSGPAKRAVAGQPFVLLR